MLKRADKAIHGFGDMIRQYEQHLIIHQKSKRTFQAYSRLLANISLHYNQLPTTLTKLQVDSYLYELKQRSASDAATSFRLTIVSLRSLYKSLQIPYDHLDLPLLRKSKKKIIVLSKDEVWRMLQVLTNDKHKLIIGMIYGCGLRCMELCNIRLRDLDYDRKTLHLKVTKGGKHRILPLSDHLIRGLKKYIQTYHPKDYLFEGNGKGYTDTVFKGRWDKQSHRYSERGVQWIVKEAMKKVGILKAATTHTLRHTYATHLLEDGLDILSVKNLMGHSRIETTMAYLHIAQIDPHKVFSPIDTLFAQCAVKVQK